MARPRRRGPSDAELGEYAARRVRDGNGRLRPLTYHEIASDWADRTGVGITSREIGRAMRAAGLSQRHVRHTEVLPWHIAMPHSRDYWAERLRLLARHLSGAELRTDEESKIRGMRLKLARAHSEHGYPVSISYDPSSGFSLVPRQSWHRQVDEDVWVVPPTGR